ncbi:HD domain-containing protein [Heliobacterium gestii]|uniref:HD domain-containing protein n=1 Tax=Heliomicrobium gestii TaxID=2699 RepID=A0A845L8M1_HELGE|nr:HD-GYP domain-containing protein [Heliomicrobium gestii]MBM7866125.1 putative nucleotidyltransferase with HDIG domain [Heliomicrobium gestii]MZP42548.1 HD domain-containing protein [Heliomicrobium gestii]
MSRITVDAVQKGLILDEPIYTKTGALLLPRGTVLDERHIHFLKNLGVESVEVTTKLARKNAKAANGRLTRAAAGANEEKSHDGTPALRDQEPPETKAFYDLLREDLLVQVNSAIVHYSQEGSHDRELGDLLTLFGDLFQEHNRVQHLLEVKSTDAFTFKHCVNVAVLAVLTGLTMRLSEDSLRMVALGGLLHDIGKKKVPPEILFAEGALSPESRRRIEEHTEHGYDTLVRDTALPEEIALIALQHHERLDGSGYPRRLQGDQIHLFSQLVGVADVFEAMTSTRNYRPGFNPVEIVEYLMGASSTLFPERIVKALLDSITIYRIGSAVQLSNGATGVVVKANAKLPSRPVVRIVFDDRRMPLRHEHVVDLSQPAHTTLCIVRSFG